MNDTNSIRRSSSAEMSSERRLQNNEFPLERVQSLEQLQTLGEEDHQKNEELNDNKDAFEDIWSSILSQKKIDETGSGDPVPYVHPLVKRASLLSEKSLEICTESLGSETGSDGFSYPSDHGEEKEEEEEEQETKKDEFVKVAKYNYYPINKKCEIGVQKRSFPTPLPSLAHRREGFDLLMKTRRLDGRVVVEAVSIPSQNCFRASREDGRLLLTLASDDDQEEQEDDVDENDEEMNGEDIAFVVNDEKLVLPQTTGIANTATRPSPTMTTRKLMELASTRSNSTWPRSSNMTVIKSVEHQIEVESTQRKTVSQSLPPRPRVSTATYAAVGLNAYEYYWQHPTAVHKPLAGKQNNFDNDVFFPQVVQDSPKRMNKFVLEHNAKGGSKEKVVEKGEYQVPIVRGCKESRRSLFFLESYCIATS